MGLFGNGDPGGSPLMGTPDTAEDGSPVVVSDNGVRYVVGEPGQGGGQPKRGAPPDAHEFKPDYNDPNACQVCGQPRRQHEKVGSRFAPGNEDDEDARGPEGDKMPRLDDAPQYTLIGQILKRLSK